MLKKQLGNIWIGHGSFSLVRRIKDLSVQFLEYRHADCIGMSNSLRINKQATFSSKVLKRNWHKFSISGHYYGLGSTIKPSYASSWYKVITDYRYLELLNSFSVSCGRFVNLSSNRIVGVKWIDVARSWQIFVINCPNSYVTVGRAVIHSFRKFMKLNWIK